MIRTVVFGVVVTAVFAWLDFLAAFFIFDWAGGSFGGLGSVGRSPATWAFPAWIVLTIALIAIDAYAIRRVYRWSVAAR